METFFHLVVLLWKYKILDKENIGDLKNRQQSYGGVHPAVYEKVQRGNRLLTLKGIRGGGSDRRILIAKYFMDSRD